MTKKIKVLIVDDSIIIQKLLTKILSMDPNIEVVGTAFDPYIARDKMVELKPDVMTLDVEMPRMDGLTFLEKVMKYHPVKTVIISSLAKEGSEIALRAMEIGAIDVIEKPALDIDASVMAIKDKIIDTVRAVARAKVQKRMISQVAQTHKVTPSALSETTHKIIAIAASTGGTVALKDMLPLFPENVPGIVIVQHMPPIFTQTFADSLNRVCPFEVREAKEGDTVVPGLALIAPGDYHMELVRKGGFYHTTLHQKPKIHGVRPAADFLFETVAQYAGTNATGVVLTGMGKDGAEGLLKMKDAGAYTITQDEKTSTIYGMPREAFSIGASMKELPLLEIPQEVIRQLQRKAAA